MSTQPGVENFSDFCTDARKNTHSNILLSSNYVSLNTNLLNIIHIFSWNPLTNWNGHIGQGATQNVQAFVKSFST